jgi:hypothetical protein
MNTFLMLSHQQYSRGLIRPDHQRQRNGGRANTKNPYAIPGTLHVWTTHFDNLFAKSVFGVLDNNEISRLAPAYPILTSLCQHCSSTETGIFSEVPFLVSFAKAQASHTTCNLCAVVYRIMDGTAGDNRNKTVLREGSSLTFARGEPPLLCLVVGPSPGTSFIIFSSNNIN